MEFLDKHQKARRTSLHAGTQTSVKRFYTTLSLNHPSWIRLKEMSSANNNQLSRWIMNSNEALRLSVVKPSPLAAAPANAVKESFSPTYTYPIFGEEEKIFGYQGLDICVRPVFVMSETQSLKQINPSCRMLRVRWKPIWG